MNEEEKRLWTQAMRLYTRPVSRMGVDLLACVFCLIVDVVLLTCVRLFVRFCGV
jgi:hypothetical protein